MMTGCSGTCVQYSDEAMKQDLKNAPMLLCKPVPYSLIGGSA